MFKKKQDIIDVIISEVLNDSYEDHVIRALQSEKAYLDKQNWKQGFATATVTIGGGLLVSKIMAKAKENRSKNKCDSRD